MAGCHADPEPALDEILSGQVYPMDKVRTSEELRLELARAVAGENSVAWVGAGASAGLYPLWDELIAILHSAATERDPDSLPALNAFQELSARQPQAATTILREIIGQGVYRQILHETFGTRHRPDGKPYTPTHESLARLPFRTYVTTNYDQGLVSAIYDTDGEARPFWGSWKDDWILDFLVTTIHSDSRKIPVLFAHGHHDQPDGIVLDIDQYRAAYRRRNFRRALETMYLQRNIVFVGYSFADTWLARIVETCADITGLRKPSGQHFAIVGVTDLADTAILTKLYAKQHGVSLVTYPISTDENGFESHHALIDLLSDLEGLTDQTPPQANISSSGGSDQETLPGPIGLAVRWIHDPTDDDLYVERHALSDRLKRWVDDREIKVIACTGVGGAGKTALMGNWLRSGGADLPRFDGVILWSFYANARVEELVDNILDLGRELGVQIDSDSRLPSALRVLRERGLLLFLDGLEVIQERPNSVDYGRFLSLELATIVQHLCRRRIASMTSLSAEYSRSIVLFTSRFPITDLEPYVGDTARTFRLERVTEPEGVEILSRYGVGGSTAHLTSVVSSLAGHPLALRVYAAAAGLAPGRPSSEGSEVAVLEILEQASSSSLGQKLARLLTFYAENLPQGDEAVLGALSLARSPKSPAELERLAATLSYGPLGRGEFGERLRVLVRGGLVMAEADENLFSAHPIVRDHFRLALIEKDPDAASRAAVELAGQPGVIGSRAQAETIIESVELLAEAGEISEAFDLYSTRMNDGQTLKTLPAPDLALRAALMFVGTKLRLERSSKVLDTRNVGFILNEAGFSASLTGDTSVAVRYLKLSERHERRSGDLENLVVSLENQAEAVLQLGHLEKARDMVEEAIGLSDTDQVQYSSILALRGHISSLLGEPDVALRDFTTANALVEELARRPMHGNPGVRYAWFLAGSGRQRAAVELTRLNRSLCEVQGWNEDRARCSVFLATHDDRERLKLPEAIRNLARGLQRANPEVHERIRLLREATEDPERVFTEGRMDSDLADLHLRRGQAMLEVGAVDDALEESELCLNIVSHRGWRIQQASALILRGEARVATLLNGRRVDEQMSVGAVDDFEAALELMASTGFALHRERATGGVEAAIDLSSRS